MKLIKFIIYLTSLLFCTSTEAGMTPHLNFSDIISGPSTGLNDGLGSGAIVTIWGNNLGEYQGTSTISIGGMPPSHIYYWKNADGQKPGGPADLYTYNRMQEISFSLPSSLPQGSTAIIVTVDGAVSNALPFTVRNGRIYHVKKTGNNSTGDGSWDNPWANVAKHTSGASTKIDPGDIVYVHDGVEEINTYLSGLAGMRIDYIHGTALTQTAFIAYPNSRVLAQGNNRGIDLYQSDAIVIAKYVVKVGNYDEPTPGSTAVLHYETAAGIKPTANGRIVGNEVTDIEGKCTSGGQGAISTNCASYDYVSNAKIYGNYLHDWGCDQTSKLQHVTYLSVRNEGAFDVDPWEYGWNSLVNNKSKYGLHAYDETFSTKCGDVRGTIKIHDNFVINQKGPGVNVGSRAATGSVCWSVGFEIYNNILINTGLGPADEDAAELAAIRVGDRGMTSNIKIYNNTIYSYGDSTSLASGRAAIWFYDIGDNSGGVTASISNNIFYDTKGLSFASINGSVFPKVTGSNNLWFSSATTSNVVPSLFSSNTFLDPLFVNVSENNFRLQAQSPARSHGIDYSTIYHTDFSGNQRAQGSFDLGAIQYYTDTPTIKGIKLK